ncbi:MAG: exodeoxyribonuclease VII small subunit [Candidatus Uhrbacteria bacterium]|nr:exodeoxyribonuclease VII small subunit [Candidatus Uhrbacteria bacterium]
MAKRKDIDFSKGFTELGEIAAWFEQGEPDLEEGMKKYERASELAKGLKGRLDEAENKIKEIRERGV